MRSETPMHGPRCPRLLTISFLHQEHVIQRDNFAISMDKEEEMVRCYSGSILQDQAAAERRCAEPCNECPLSKGGEKVNE